MQIDLDSTSNIFETNSIVDWDIVSKFFINNSSFLVISIEAPVTNVQDFSSNTIGSNYYSVLGQFESDGYYYAIVKIHKPSESIDSSLMNILTGRELQIAALVALGCSNKKVANQLQISEWTVSAHLRRIFIKLKVDSRSAMVYRCASLINRLHELRTIQQQMPSNNQSGDVPQSAINKQTLQSDMAEIDRLLCSILANSSVTLD